MCLAGLQESEEAMGLVLDEAMGTGLKPPVVLLGATLPSGLAADASNRVRLALSHSVHTSLHSLVVRVLIALKTIEHRKLKEDCCTVTICMSA